MLCWDSRVLQEMSAIFLELMRIEKPCHPPPLALLVKTLKISGEISIVTEYLALAALMKMTRTNSATI